MLTLSQRLFLVLLAVQVFALIVCGLCYWEAPMQGIKGSAYKPVPRERDMTLDPLSMAKLNKFLRDICDPAENIKNHKACHCTWTHRGEVVVGREDFVR